MSFNDLWDDELEKLPLPTLIFLSMPDPLDEWAERLEKERRANEQSIIRCEECELKFVKPEGFQCVYKISPARSTGTILCMSCFNAKLV